MIKRGQDGFEQFAAAQAKKEQLNEKKAAFEAVARKEKAAAAVRTSKYARKPKPGGGPAPAAA